jgi:hypothetical protein
MTLSLTVTVAYVVNFLWRHADCTAGRPVTAGQLTLSAGRLALLTVSGYLGGKLAYRYGVRVADEATQAEGFTGPCPAARLPGRPAARPPGCPAARLPGRVAS